MATACLIPALLHLLGTNLSPLRILTSIELFSDAKFYAYHPQLISAWHEPDHSSFTSEKSMFTAIISDDAGLLYVRKDDNREFCIQKEADVISETTVSASFVCICAVSSVLRCKIVSYYPRCGARGVKDLMNCMIEPREPCLLNDRIIHVLWSRDSNFDSRPGVRYHPNNFVPLFVVSGEAVRSEKLDPQTESRGQLKITSLLKNKTISTTLDRKPA